MQLNVTLSLHNGKSERCNTYTYMYEYTYMYLTHIWWSGAIENIHSLVIWNYCVVWDWHGFYFVIYLTISKTPIRTKSRKVITSLISSLHSSGQQKYDKKVPRIYTTTHCSWAIWIKLNVCKISIPILEILKYHEEK